MFDTELKRIYTEKQLLDSNGVGKTLHTSCPNCKECWHDLTSRMPTDDSWWSVSRPWVGPHYSESRLLALGINMNEYGSYNGAIELVESAKKELATGKRKIFVSPTYKGTIFYHRMASYAAALIEKSVNKTHKWINSFPTPEDVVNAYDYLAYSNHIKCSPAGEKSRPSWQMWERCGAFLLKDEIRILNPSTILVMGVSDNFKNLNTSVLDQSAKMKWSNNVGIGTGSVYTKRFQIVVLPHPTSRGGNSYDVMDNLRTALRTI